jgi:hypothetical protein
MIAAPIRVRLGQELSKMWLNRLLNALPIAMTIEMTIKIFHEF